MVVAGAGDRALWWCRRWGARSHHLAPSNGGLGGRWEASSLVPVTHASCYSAWCGYLLCISIQLDIGDDDRVGRNLYFLRTKATIVGVVSVLVGVATPLLFVLTSSNMGNPSFGWSDRAAAIPQC
jgi:hypothetical protein